MQSLEQVYMYCLLQVVVYNCSWIMTFLNIQVELLKLVRKLELLTHIHDNDFIFLISLSIYDIYMIKLKS